MNPSYIVVQSSTDWGAFFIVALFLVFGIFLMSMVKPDQEPEEKQDFDGVYLDHLRKEAEKRAIEKQILIDKIQTERMIQDVSKYGYIHNRTLEHIENNTPPTSAEAVSYQLGNYIDPEVQK